MTARDPRWGIAGLVGGAALVLLALVVVARYPALLAGGDTYHAEFDDVAGLDVGDEVRFGGLLVGAVTELRISRADPSRILVTFKVKDRAPITAETRATIAQVGLLGDPYLALRSDGSSTAVLPPGSTIPSERSFGIQDAMTRIAQFLDRADTLLGGVERVAATSPWDRVNSALERFERLAAVTTEGSERVFGRIDTTTARLDQLVHRTDRMIAVLDTTVRAAAPGFADAQREALVTLREARGLLLEVREALDAGGGVDDIVRNLADASENIERLTSRLERNPASLLRPRAEPRKPVGPPIR